MAAPRVSIITPTYNHEAFIGACIESVLAQTFADWELIVVDDGSTDRTGEIAQSYSDPRIHYLRQENKGLSRLAESYNSALAVAKGDLVAILEGDDTWPVDKLAVQVPDFDDPGVVLSWGRALMVDSTGKTLRLVPENLPDEGIRTNQPIGRASFAMCDHEWLTFAFPITVVMRATALREIGGFQQKSYLRYVDLPTFMTLGLKGKWAFHDHNVGYWRRHEASATLSSFPSILEGAYQLADDFIEEHRNELPVSDAELEKVDRFWGYFQFERLMLLGRVWADQGRFGEAAAAFHHAQMYRLRWKTRAMLRVAASMCHLRMSPEIAFRLGKRTTWRNQYPPEIGDPIIRPDMNVNEFKRHDLTRH